VQKARQGGIKKELTTKKNNGTYGVSSASYPLRAVEAGAGWKEATNYASREDKIDETVETIPEAVETVPETLSFRSFGQPG
jgi:hypothetical protein